MLSISSSSGKASLTFTVHPLHLSYELWGPCCTWSGLFAVLVVRTSELLPGGWGCNGHVLVLWAVICPPLCQAPDWALDVQRGAGEDSCPQVQDTMSQLVMPRTVRELGNRPLDFPGSESLAGGREGGLISLWSMAWLQGALCGAHLLHAVGCFSGEKNSFHPGLEPRDT